VRGKEFDDLATPRATGLDVKDGQFGGHGHEDRPGAGWLLIGQLPESPPDQSRVKT
jgi:hypothetical protein